jgi:hypothetical protein
VLALLAALFCTMSILAQNFSVKGLVTDKSGEPIIGATVMEAETKNGVATDLDGAFTIKVNSDKAVLRVSYIGYKTQEVAVNGRSEMKVVLSDDVAANLAEVVVIGMERWTKELTSAISQVSSKNFTQWPRRPLNDDSGKVAGVRSTTPCPATPIIKLAFRCRRIVACCRIRASHRHRWCSWRPT